MSVRYYKLDDDFSRRNVDKNELDDEIVELAHKLDATKRVEVYGDEVTFITDSFLSFIDDDGEHKHVPKKFRVKEIYHHEGELKIRLKVLD